MASFSTSSTLKVILVSSGVLTAALALKHTVPVVSDFILSECPSIWTFILTLLRPPYLYILMNCIIIGIVASSKLQQRHKVDHSPSPDDPLVLLPPIQTLTTAPVKISEHLPADYNTVVLPPSQNLTQEPILVSRDVGMKYAVSGGVVSEANSNVTSSKLQHRYKLERTLSPDGPLGLLPSIQTLTIAPVKISEDLPTEYNTVFLPPSQNLTQQEPILASGNVRREYAVSNGVVSKAKVYDANVQEPQTPKLTDHKEVVSGSDEANSHVRTSIQRMDSSDFSFEKRNEKPPVSARFRHHRKAVKASTDGGKAALGVMKAKRHDTLESTWKMITEGHSMPLNRHLKKCDTWDSQQRRNSPLTDQNGTHEVKKSETFNGRSENQGENVSRRQTPSSGIGKLKKEPSVGQEELNRRVEAFINKFNEEMRLQREESLRQYHEMISRGAH